MILRRLGPAAALAVPMAADAQAPAKFPPLEAGLWRMTSRTNAEDGPKGELCISADRQLPTLAPSAAGVECDPMTSTPRGGGVNVTGVCRQPGPPPTVTRITRMGELNEKIIDTAEVSEVGPDGSQKLVLQMIVESERVGPCPAGVAPGDLFAITPDGKRVKRTTRP